jgi:parvulin-like peptidyl-prolyl isomerase
MIHESFGKSASQLLEGTMVFRIFLWFVAAMLLACTNVSAIGEGAGQSSGAVGNPAVTIELPLSSPHLHLLSQSEIEAASVGGVARIRVPLDSEQLEGLPLAEVDEQPVTLGELRRALMPAVAEGGEAPSSPGKANPEEVLARLVGIRLIVREAREIGLDELPEVRNLVDVYSRRTLRELLILRRVKGVEADEAEVEKLYREAVREWRISALIFKESKDAEAFRGDVSAGAAFDEAAGKYVSEGKAEAKGGKEGEFVKAKDISPEMEEKIGALNAGSVTPVIKTGDGFAVIKLEEVRITENAEARDQARQRARNYAQNISLAEYHRQLAEKYAKLDRELFEKLDFGISVDNFLRMRKDDRVVAQIEGEAPLTVSRLAQGIQEQYYHGLEKAIGEGTINEKKIPVLDDILFKRVFHKEALAQGIDKTPEYLGMLEDYENSVLFGAFIERVLRPEIKITPADLRQYFDRHVDQFTYPEMVRLRSLVFGNATAAQAALDKLRKGTDFRWMKANADGQVPSEIEEATRFGDGLVIVKDLPEAVRQVLGGVKEGSVVLYQQGEKYFHVLSVEKHFPSRVQPFEDAQKVVLQQAYKEKLENAFSAWVERLKTAYGAKVYVKEFSGSAP